jgi:hypothetical protein
MDCERFEANMIDELYEELDELTSAAAKRHVAGCARCASLVGGLRATRRVALLPRVEPPIDLEDKILAAARRAQNVVPIGRRFSRAISLAGSWAMRPQTAMAAVFLLMVGSSLLFVRRGRVSAGDGMRVTAQGQPAGDNNTDSFGESAPSSPIDSKAAAAAHGAPHPAAAPAPVAAASAAPMANEPAYGAPKERAALPLGSDIFNKDDESTRRTENASIPAGAPAATSAPPVTAHRVAQNDAPIPSDLDKAPDGKNQGWGAQKGGGGSASAGLGAAQGAAPGPDLQAAISTANTTGCGAAVGALDSIGKDAWGTADGYEATFQAGVCYQRIGNTELARQRFQRLITVPQYSSKALAQINSLSPNQGQVAAARAAAPTKKAAAKPSAPPPAQQQAPTQTTTPVLDQSAK